MTSPTHAATTLYVVLEANARCAVLYLRGPLHSATLERAVVLCAALPPQIAELRIDARDVPLMDPGTHAGLRALVGAWRSSRDGGPSRSLVTISLHDRALVETGSGQLPRTIQSIEMPLSPAAP